MTEDYRDKDVAKCRGDFRYTDYEDDEAPSKVQAALMCAGCPLFDQCGEFALKIRPTHGVWAGKVWVYGKDGTGRMRK